MLSFFESLRRRLCHLLGHTDEYFDTALVRVSRCTTCDLLRCSAVPPLPPSTPLNVTLGFTAPVPSYPYVPALPRCVLVHDLREPQ